MNTSFIYLDYNATTPVDPAVCEAMLPFLESVFGNPSSSYRLGREAAAAIATAREQVAALLSARASELVFTGSGTEATVTAFHSALSACPEKKQIITSSVEHSATKLLCLDLERRGYEITWLPVDERGQLSLEQLEKAITPATALVSLIWGNNETGVFFPIEKIAAITRAYHVPLHVDAIQIVGKKPIDLSSLEIQYLSLSGHKIYAPKGIGALYVHRHAPYIPLLRGFQEEERRGGTENVASIVALGKAALLSQQLLCQEMTREASLRDGFEERLLKNLDAVFVNGDVQHRLSNTSHLIFKGVNAATALLLFDEQGVYCSAGSACNSDSCDPSSVLMAMGRSAEEALSGIRFSVGRFTTEKEIDRAVEIIVKIIKKLRGLVS